MSRMNVIIRGERQRQYVAELAEKVVDGTRVEFKPPKRSEEQNARMWWMLGQIARQVRHHTLELEPEDWKVLFLNALKRETRMVPNLDGNGFVSLNQSSSDLGVGEMNDLIELMHAFAARHGVVFPERRAR